MLLKNLHDLLLVNNTSVRNGQNGLQRRVIYNEIYDFANYAFNKAHAVCYAVVAYQTAWFKLHYPKEYMAALLTSVLDWSEKVADYINECRHLLLIDDAAVGDGQNRLQGRVLVGYQLGVMLAGETNGLRSSSTPPSPWRASPATPPPTPPAW